MITEKQRRILMNELNLGSTMKKASLKADIDPKTGLKYRDGYVPSNHPRSYSTRTNPFSQHLSEIDELISHNEGLEAKTIFEHLQQEYPGVYQDGQLRSLQRYIKNWRVNKGSAKEVVFPQHHPPGHLGASDFTSLNHLNITINGEHFKHKLYHFVLTHSNWQTGTICQTESFASLSTGLQNALWRLGYVPKYHLTDSLAAAVKNHSEKREFTRLYDALLKHYQLIGRKTQPRSPNENGDVEQANYRFKKALDQSLMLRGSRDFSSRSKYETYLNRLFDQLNSGRTIALKRELEVMHKIPSHRIDVRKKIKVKVSKSSTVRVDRNTYSVPSRLIDSKVTVFVGMEEIEIFYGDKYIMRAPRLSGRDQYSIEYRHIIDSLMRKPGAFENYQYRESMFPSTHFRVAYDVLINSSKQGVNTYLQILNVAAKISEVEVENALIQLHNNGQTPNLEIIEHLLDNSTKIENPHKIEIPNVDLSLYDEFLNSGDSHE